MGMAHLSPGLEKGDITGWLFPGLHFSSSVEGHGIVVFTSWTKKKKTEFVPREIQEKTILSGYFLTIKTVDRSQF
jgi:hypothetical protein